MTVITRFVSALVLCLTLAACGSGDGEGDPPSAAETNSQNVQAGVHGDAQTAGDTQTSRVSFEYTGDFEGAASTDVVIAGTMTDQLTGITANLDGYSSQSDTLAILLRNQDFEVGKPSDVFVEDRNTLTLTMDGYALQLQPGSMLTVLEKTAGTFRAEADELVLTGHEVMDFERRNPSRTVTIRNLRFNYVE